MGVRVGWRNDETRPTLSAADRVVLVSLTPSGRESAQSAPLGGIPLLRERLKALPPERLAMIHEALAEIKQILEIDDEQ